MEKIVMPDGTGADTESLKFRWGFSNRQGNLTLSMTVTAVRNIFPDERLRKRRCYPSLTVAAVRNGLWRLSVSFPLVFPWRRITDGNRHGWSFRRFSELFLTGLAVRKQLGWCGVQKSRSVTEELDWEEIQLYWSQLGKVKAGTGTNIITLYV